MLEFLEFVKERSKKKIVLVVGSARSPDCCPNEQSKTHKIAEHLQEKFKDRVRFEIIDLSVKCDGVNVQPCKACTSTSAFHCHWPCIEGTQRVHLLDGFKKIEDIKAGDVLQDGNKVIKHLLTSSEEEIFELKIADGRSLKMTSNHKVKTLSKNRFRDVSSGFAYYRKEDWKELKDISIGDYIPHIETDNMFPDEGNDEDDRLYTIYGMIWGDGTLCGDSAILYVDEKENDFLTSIEQNFTNEIISVLDHSTPNSKIRSSQSCVSKMKKINFGTIVGRKFKQLFKKDKAEERRLNLDAFQNKRQIFNFLNGWISTDGSINRSKSIQIYNTSYIMLKDLQLLLSRISIKSNISDLRHLSSEIKGKTYQRCSYISISDQESLSILAKNVSLLHAIKQKKIEKYRSDRRKIKRSFSVVKEINYIGKGKVYDIEVENSHFFNCEGIKVHNCDCYNRESDPKDLMHQEDVYKKLEECDGFFVLTPINWSSCSSVVKTFFDRLVCASLTITTDEALKILGEDDLKNSKKTREIEKSGKHNSMLKNHLQGKHAGFFAHGNEGGADYREFAKNKTKSLPIVPDSLIEYEKTHGKEDVSKLLDPLVKQCVYMGVHVPDDCVRVETYGYGISYSEVNDKFDKEQKIKESAEKTLGRLLFKI